MSDVCNFGKRVYNSMMAMNSSPSIISLFYSPTSSPRSKTDESNFPVRSPVVYWKILPVERFGAVHQERNCELVALNPLGDPNVIHFNILDSVSNLRVAQDAIHDITPAINLVRASMGMCPNLNLSKAQRIQLFLVVVPHSRS